MSEIRGRRVLITGAAAGMGLGMAERFAAEGAEPVLVDVNESGLAEAARRVGKPSRTYVCDVSRPDQISGLRDRIHRELGPIDILVNNAGVVSGGVYEDIPPEKDRLMLDVNVGAVHWMTKAFLPDLKAKRAGHIVNLASAAGFLGVPQQVVYCASKWFVLGFSEALRLELEQLGYHEIHVTVVCPSYVDTGMFAGVRAPLFTPILKPGFVVDRIITAVKEDQVSVREPFIVKTTPLLKAMLPRRVFETISDRLGVTRSMHGWRGHEARQ
jgi:all-trans-retinol dehydrogenase (NAD+)